MSKSIISIVRAVVGKDINVYNDRLVSGARSIKVGGRWAGNSRGQTIKVKSALERAGYLVEIAVSNDGNFRLHVAEGPQAQLDI